MKALPKIVGAVLAAVLLAACARDMNLTATFAAPAGLAAGAVVYLGAEKAGEVSRLTTSGDMTKAEISVDPDLTGLLRTGTAALLTIRDGRTVIELYNYRPGARTLQDGDELVGLNNSLEFAAWQTGEALDSGRQSMEAMSRSIADYFEGDEWRQQRERMNRQMEDLKEELGRAYDDTNDAYRAFMDDLERETGAARERARESYAELARKLRQHIERLEKQGNDNLVEPLQRLLEDLSRAMERKPEQEST